MEYLLLWSDESDRVLGYKNHFKSKSDFIKQVELEFKKFIGGNCIVNNVKIESCIETDEGIPGDSIIPLSATDIEISNYYIADVIEEVD